MTSKLSVHVNQKPTGLSGFLQKCADAHNSIGIIYAVDINIKPDILAHSPTTKLIYRRQTDQFNRQPDGYFNGDPIVNCEKWFNTPDPADNNRTLFQNWEMNPADWYDPLNEIVPDIKEKAIWHNAWTVHAISIAASHGFKLAIGSTPTGTPPIEMWQYMIPMLQVGKNNNSILNLHAYWGEGQHRSPEWIDSFNQNALRYRQVWNVLPASARIPIVYSEASPGNGYDPSDSETGSRWIENMDELDAEMLKDPYILGACGYQLGGQESNMKDIISAYGDHIAQSGVIVTPPPPVTTPRYFIKARYDNHHIRSTMSAKDDSNIVGSMAAGAKVEVKSTPSRDNDYWWYQIIGPDLKYKDCWIAQQTIPQVLADVVVE